ncbi:MAG: hypothetical protein M3355_09910 [Actinomycetota bacterium]|nr:hypothetical protein [Actinomycetota bacterium]
MAFRRAFFGYRRADVDQAVLWRDRALEKESARVDALTARSIAEEERADGEAVRALELERASFDLAVQVESLEQVADRLAQRVVERDRQIATLNARLDAATWTRQSAEARVEDVADVPAEAVAQSAEVFAGTVEVELGPLSDFGQLASFEDAANGIGGAEEISVTGFTEGRATLEMQLSEPVELLRELEERAPFEFTVRDTRGDRVVLDVDSEAA